MALTAVSFVMAGFLQMKMEVCYSFLLAKNMFVKLLLKARSKSTGRRGFLGKLS